MRNLEETQKEVNWVVRGIKSCAQHEVMEKVQNQVIIRLHEMVVIPTLLNNAELDLNEVRWEGMWEDRN